MILGMGSDIVDIRRIERTLERFGERFIERIYTDIERRKSDRRAARAASYAKRFAAKEACAKALGTGMRRGVFWRDMGVVNMRSGQPTMALTGGARHGLPQECLLARPRGGERALRAADHGASRCRARASSPHGPGRP